MKRPAPDGSTERVMKPLELLSALASLVPPPRVHLTRYHGCFAPDAKNRALVVPRSAARDDRKASIGEANGTVSRDRRLAWADLLRRVLAIDIFRCDCCGGRRRVLAAITEPLAIRAILEHLGLPLTVPPVVPARPPPCDLFDLDAAPSFEPASIQTPPDR
jgi:hypothetical protein